MTREDRKSVIMITSDSVRADYCFTAFNGHPTTPTLERFGEAGVVFENAIAPGPRTSTSVPELMTGQVHGTPGDVTSDVQRIRLIGQALAETETLPERLSSLGYHTVAVTANPYTTAETGFGDIFDELYDTGSYRSSTLQNAIPNKTLQTAYSLFRQYTNKMHWFMQWPEIFEEILGIVDSLVEPYFLWIFLLDTHNPYIAPRRDRHESTTFGMYRGVLRGNDIRRNVNATPGVRTTYHEELPDAIELALQYAYRDTIRSVDRFVGTLWESVEADDPTLLFNSDHGEAFNEHGSYGHESFLYEENVHVPSVVYNADDVARIDGPVSLRLLPDMIVSYVDEGISFADPQWQDAYAYSSAEDGSFAVRGRRWKYVRSERGDELYDLEDDPGERRDISSERADVVERMRRHADVTSTGDGRSSVSSTRVEIDDDLEQRLESLGYRS